jgi:hypothetical protein
VSEGARSRRSQDGAGAGRGRSTPPPDRSAASNPHWTRLATAGLGGGRELPASVRAHFEPRFGADFGGVRIHTGPQAEASASALQARAFTVGRDIVFGRGELAPETGRGRHLLAHELTHVLQQSGAGGPRGPQCLREVDGAGTKAATSSNVSLYPEGAPKNVRVEELAHVRGGLETDMSLRPRVMATLGPGATVRGIAKKILPFFVKAAPGSVPSVDEIAKAILVYSQEYIPVPLMTRYRVGLNLPLPIEIAVDNGDWVVSPSQITGWAAAFDPAWAALNLLDRAPEDLKVASAADQEAAVDVFLRDHPTALGRGIALSTRLLENAFDSDQFALRVLDRLGGEAFQVALEFMEYTLVHEAGLIASLGGGMAVFWRLRTLLSLPPAGLSEEDEKRRQRFLTLLPTESVLGVTAKGRPVQAFYFQGTSSERAMMIAGVHGSEQSGVEVLQLVIDELRQGTVRPYYTTLIVPIVFPDNFAKALREGSTETNRDFPERGTSLDTATRKGGAKGPVDALGKQILPENVMLLHVLERWRPSRLATVHATFDRSKAGVFTDPRTVSKGALEAAKAQGQSTADLEAAAKKATAEDRKLAFDMAKEADKRGANVKGNQLDKGDAFNDDFPAPRPVGVSMGGYGPQDVTEGKATDRPSMTVITMEVGGNEDSSKETNPKKLEKRMTELRALRDVLLFLFLKAPEP